MEMRDRRYLFVSGFTLYAQLLLVYCILTVTANSDTGIMTQRSNSVEIRDLQDTWTPIGVALSGIYKRSFAYITLKDRLPVILTRIIDSLSRNKEKIAQKYGQEALDDVKQMSGYISKLKNEIVTNKTLKPMRLVPDDPSNDAGEWNKYLMRRTDMEGGTPTWFNTAWLYCECYMYRIVAQEFSLMNHLKDYDPFKEQKETAFTNSLIGIHGLAAYTMNLVQRAENLSIHETKEELFKLLKLNLWGNTCDLSLSAGAEVGQTKNSIDMLKSLDKNILVNHTELAWNVLRKKETNDRDTVDIILDNAGYELFTDFCLAVFMVSTKLVSKIRFYVKRYPWYISDVTVYDFHWSVDYMQNSSNRTLQQFGQLASNYLKDNIWTIEEELFWTGPYNFAEMKEQDPVLYAKLSEAKMAIFKGDLNYRKLLGDINFEYTTNFMQALRGFQPTNILSLRTVKSDVCVGLLPGVAEDLFRQDEKWLFTGKYGLIQSTTPKACPCTDKIC